MTPHRSTYHGSARLLLGAAVTILAGSLASFAHANEFIGPISEETANHRGPCGPDEAITGMQCTGSYCDNLYIYCEYTPGVIDNAAPAYYSQSYFGSGGSCGDGIAIGVECQGSYCNSIRLLCKPLLTPLSPGEGGATKGSLFCSTTGLTYFSDEQPFCDFGGSVLVSLSCNGNHCDNMFPVGGGWLPTRGQP